MKVFIATDYYLDEKNNRYYVASALYSILKRYYDAFGKVIMCTRIRKIETTDNMYDITELVESVVEIQNLMTAFSGECKGKMKRYMRTCDLVVARVPSIIAYRAVDCAKKLNIPYFTESMGCAWDAYWNHGISGKIIAPYMYFKMKEVVKHADYALYVTNKFLQKRYPCKNESIAASNVKISKADNGILEKRLDKIAAFDKKNIVLMTMAAVDVRYKGQQYVIKAIPLLKKRGINATYILAGGGNQEYLKSVAQKYGVENKVIFTGKLSLEKVLDTLDEADIYVQPSLQEGLPRSVIEAMSRGCPCIGARTAGIPELIDCDCVFKRKSAKAIADTIEYICNKEVLVTLANENLKNSESYIENVLDKKRNMYYQKIKEIVAK